MSIIVAKNDKRNLCRKEHMHYLLKREVLSNKQSTPYWQFHGTNIRARQIIPIETTSSGPKTKTAPSLSSLTSSKRFKNKWLSSRGSTNSSNFLHFNLYHYTKMSNVTKCKVKFWVWQTLFLEVHQHDSFFKSFHLKCHV